MNVRISLTLEASEMFLSLHVIVSLERYVVSGQSWNESLVYLRASPFNVTIIKVYAPTSGYDDSEVDEFYSKLQSLLIKH